MNSQELFHYMWKQLDAVNAFDKMFNYGDDTSWLQQQMDLENQQREEEEKDNDY